MTITVSAQTEFERTEELVGWVDTLAWWVSQVGSPPVLGLGATALAAANLATTTAWRWGISYAALTILTPCLYISWLVYRGQVTDFHLPRRAERLRPLLVTLFVSLLACCWLWAAAAPQLLQLLARVNGLQTALFLAITLRWKISLHTAAAAMLAVLGLATLGSDAVPLAVAVPIIAWSRVRLHRHTLAQTLAGAALGASLLLTALYYSQ
jgi:membrane-associated phospholipid phosphatase